jgi:hypothetical protein
MKGGGAGALKTPPTDHQENFLATPPNQLSLSRTFWPGRVVLL